jgi:cytochrome c5
MRRWFIVLLIVLLPWRAWAGDAMLLSMAPTGNHSASAATFSSSVPHCADHASTEPASPGEPTVHAICDICNGPLLAVAPPVGAGTEPLPPSRLTAGAERFASALPHPGQKPPIS